MKTYIQLGYQTGLLFENDASDFIKALQTASFVTCKGYGKDRVFEPTQETITIELLTDVPDETAMLKLLHEKEAELSKQSTRAWKAESELIKLKKQFSLE